MAGSSAFAKVAGSLGWFVVPVYVGFLMLMKPFPIQRFEDYLPFLKPETRADVVYLIREFVNIIVAFFRGQIIIAFLQGVLLAIGKILREQGNYEQAYLYFCDAQSAQPHDVLARVNLGAVLTDLGRLEEAIELLEETLPLKADFSPTYYNLGVALAKLKQFEQAQDAFRQVIALRPDRLR